MAITFKYAGASFTADTPREAAETLALLKKQESQRVEKGPASQASESRIPKESDYEAFMARKISQGREYAKQARALVNSFDENSFSWTSERFSALIYRLGKAQKQVLALLLTKRSLRDDELRKSLKVPNNQALAGVLSGISKQAIALFIPPRAIFNFENFRNGGRRRSDYLASDEFRKIAAELNWPPSSAAQSPISQKA